MQPARKHPLPQRDEALYTAVLESGFAAYPERKANYLKYKESQREILVDHYPIQFDIENVSRCNYRCTMCQMSDWNGRRAEDMSLEDFKFLLDSQPGLIEVKIQGMGEPFLGAHFFDMIRYARQRHLWVRSSTNGSLLRVNENYRKVLDADICELQVSIDATTPEVYAAIRRGGDLAIVKEGCRLLNEYGARVNKKRTRMWTLLQKTNLQELKAFPRFAAELGFERLSIARDLNAWGTEEWEKRNDDAEVRDLFDYSIIDELVEDGKKQGVEVSFWFNDAKKNWDDPKNLCPMLFERATITSDMKVLPCGAYGDPKNFNLGDAQDVSAVWNSEAMKAFRTAHFSGNIPRWCKPCYDCSKKETGN